MLLLIPQAGKGTAALQQVLQGTQASPLQQQAMQMLLPLLLGQRAAQLLQAVVKQRLLLLLMLDGQGQQRQVLLLGQGQQRAPAQQQSSRANQVHRLVLLGGCKWRQASTHKT